MYDDASVLLQLARSRFDCYVFVQTEYIAAKLAGLGLGRFVVIPMYDGALHWPDEIWFRLAKAQLISFCRYHHQHLQTLRCASSFFRYFPPLEFQQALTELPDDRAFFWERKPDSPLNAKLAVELARSLGVRQLHIHRAPDAGKSALIGGPQVEASSGLQITTSGWLQNPTDAARLASNALFYIAPRAVEGIGMAALEAMGRGQIVVAADMPTLNEYIAHGVSGLLYNPETGVLAPWDPSEMSALRVGARRVATTARSDWESSIERFKSVILGDGRRWSTSDTSSAFVNSLRGRALEMVKRSSEMGNQEKTS